jgi:K+-transporting ATPase ATPase A chain
MNNLNAWTQLALYVGALILITKPLGLYLVQVLDVHGETWIDRIVRPVERLTYTVCGIDPEQEQGWMGYTVSMLLFSFVGMLFTYFILRFQDHLPLNPQNLPGLAPHLAFNTAASFTTNTNWQFYGGESTMSYFSQMVGLALHNFTSAATGISIAAALVRGIARHTARTIGNFWVDVVRVTYYLLVPICLVFALVLVSQGMIQNFKPNTAAKTIEPYTTQVPKTDANGQPVNGADGRPLMVDQVVDTQIIVQGPMASQIAIKMLGTNGGGYANANAAHPFENPTPLSNFLQILSIFAIPSALTWYLGRMVKNQRHGWAVWGAMFLMFLAGVLVAWRAESAGNPIHQKLGVAVADGNLEGKEVRFGIFNSALFATITTDASCGAVNAMHDSFTPLGGLVPMFNMQTGEVIFGGVGAGLYGMLIFVVLAVFIAGLMVGRTPEYLGVRREAGHDRADGTVYHHSCLHRVGRDHPLGQGRIEQRWPARIQRNPLRVQLRRRQQRERVRRTHRQRDALGHDDGPGDADWPLSDDRADPSARRQPRRQKADSGQRGHFPVRRIHFRGAAHRHSVAGRRPHVPAGARDGSRHRALPHARRHAVLSPAVPLSATFCHEHQGCFPV